MKTTRDQLIEELKKLPTNSDITFRLELSRGDIEEVEDLNNFDFDFVRVDTVPTQIVILS